MANDEIVAADLRADRARALALNPVSRETEERLDRFVALLLARQRITNLIAPSTIAHLWTRHVADSLQLLELAGKATIWADLGSGGGFPGLVLACALANKPGAEIHLVESNQKKAAFLAQAARELRVPAAVHPIRAEQFIETARNVQVVTARAVAPLESLLSLVAPLVQKGAIALLPKGRDYAKELTAAAKYWNIEHTTVPSKTNPESRVVIVRYVQLRNRG